MVNRKSFWDSQRNKSGWGYGLVEWQDEGTVHISVVFSWLVQEAYQRAVWHRANGRRVMAGGPALLVNPSALSSVAETGDLPDTVARHNPSATFTTRGCIRQCPFCIVPKIEGELKELDDWPVRPNICDNNFLASSRAHFDRSIDRLKGLPEVDFNQGLDARLLTHYMAYRIAELHMKCVRLAWDSTSNERSFLRAFQILDEAGFPANMIYVYTLIGFNDTPEDALYRLETIRSLGAWPNPMRYQPLDCKEKNSYVGENWTNRELNRYMRYWSNLNYFGNIPFDQYTTRKRSYPDPNQLPMAVK